MAAKCIMGVRLCVLHGNETLCKQGLAGSADSQFPVNETMYIVLCIMLVAIAFIHIDSLT